MRKITMHRIAGGQSHAPGAWLQTLRPAISLAALGVVGFLYVLALASAFPAPAKVRDILIFFFGTMLLPPLCAVVQSRSRPNFEASQAGYAETVNSWTAIAVFCGLTVLSGVLWLVDAATETWLDGALRIVRVSAVMNLIALVSGAWHDRVLDKRLRWLIDRGVQATLFVIAFSIAAVALFNINLEDRSFNGFFKVFIDPPFIGRWLGLAVAVAFLVTATVAFSAWLEHRMEYRRAALLARCQFVALATAIPVVVLAFFDFRLILEPLHYLTNVGPALHLLHGGTLMVDTFSQYGPGPVVATLLAFLVGPRTLGTAQVLTQCFNLTFYAIWLICLFRMTRWKVTALLLGLAAVGVMLAAWDYGEYPINLAPSILGFRYLPALGMCLAISCLRPGSRNSIYTFAATLIAGVWSLECLVIALAVHGAYIVMADLRNRAIVRLVIDNALAFAPAGAAVAAMSIYTLASAGTLPSYATYLKFFTVYNPLSEFWSHRASPLFLAWMTMLLVVFLVFGEGWRRVLVAASDGAEVDDNYFRKFVPMATLTVALAVYFVSRSYDYTLLIAALPFSALAIPAVLYVACITISTRSPAVLLLLIPALLGISALTFTVLALGRPAGPNSFLLQQCRDEQHCSLPALMSELQRRLQVREVVEETGNPLADRWLELMRPPHLVRDAVVVIAAKATNDREITVLLGENMASELALLHTGKWQRWPISFSFTDGLVSGLAERIVAAPVHLQPGEFVLTRRDEASLGYIERGILGRIRAESQLCMLPEMSPAVVAYRVAEPTGCQ